jgi:hypothetical protein
MGDGGLVEISSGAVFVYFSAGWLDVAFFVCSPSLMEFAALSCLLTNFLVQHHA